ncbi:MAG: Asp-tRNA(Asn)/Glu-tRNA(Gln) amidotransferase GatCAB subunit A [Acidobacteriia bacterium]|nr:Asp-tRNA(Asn)/Glu-tRNA(Gln) amidotransferase GatCAB subunit A [Terriglobia bacterium]
MGEIGAALRAKKISVRELTEEALRRVAEANPRLNAFLTVTEAAARARAEALEDELARGIDRGPLHGIPIAHKDNICTRGVRTTSGSKIFADFVPEHDAAIVSHLNDAGAVMIGKTGMHEFAYGITSNNPHFGAIRNPWDLGRIPGGSSGGSAAAVATGLIPLATGSDTGGSIRIPASFCGVVGLKPTYERVSRKGVMPLGLTLDHAGLLAGSVRDTALGYNLIAKHSSGYLPPAHADLRGMRIGVPENFFVERIAPEVMLSFRAAVQTAAALGAHVTEIRLPDVEAVNVVGRVAQLSEVSALLAGYLDRRTEIGRDILVLVEQGRLIPAIDYLNAQRVRTVLARDFSKIWKNLDCLMTPATAITAPKIGEMTVAFGSISEDVRMAATRLARPFNVLGWPALALPCGFSSAGLPIGLQLVAPPQQEDTLLQAGAALEDAFGIAGRRPPLP